MDYLRREAHPYAPITPSSGTSRSPATESNSQFPRSQWGVHWYTPFIMVLTFFLGIAGALLHHFLYQGRVDKDAFHQQWYTRAGTGLAFLSKTLFAASIGISHRQRIWHTLRTKSISIGGIDALFSATVNPLSLFNLDMIFHSKLSAVMAILSWLIPISAIVAPATLLVGPKQFGPLTNLTAKVPYFDLTDWNVWYNKPAYNQSLLPVSLSDYGSTSEDYWYNGPSQTTKKIAQAALYGGNILPIPTPLTANYSYTVELNGPALSCQNMGNATTDENKSYAGTYYYIASLVPVDEKSIDGKLGLANRLRVYGVSHPLNSSGGGGITTQNVLCTPYNANYSVSINFSNGNPVYKIQNLTLLSPIDESAVGYIGGGVSHTSGQAWAARSLIYGIYDIVLGSIFYNGILQTENTTVALTKMFINPTEFIFTMMTISFAEDLPRVIEEMSHNLTLSLLSITDTQITTPIQYTENRLVFIYTKWVLISAYSAAAAATLLCLVIGLAALRTNGISSDVSFSRVLVTTRNSELDRLALGACLGGDPFPKNLWKSKLKFGELLGIKDDKGFDAAHAGFGMEEVVPLEKGKKYL